uniref:Peroxisomal biogenesis factor 11 alpha n=1 Tax=Molossus molossus TaxID=27622 RepID=A0A7J8BL09_MOLMO|nr:peroxisomal biogenesis factor 11 alpha [Molossus molossus]
MEAFTRFTNQTQGRDRLFRATQYTCMLLRYLLEPKADKEELVMKLKKLESSVSTGRRYKADACICACVLGREAVQRRP